MYRMSSRQVESVERDAWSSAVPMKALTPTHEAVAAYYDEDCEHCLRDFVRGNLRAQRATAFALHQLQRHRARSVLEIGCGIGTASYTFCRNCEGLSAFAVDISDKRIEVARRLFRHPRLEFGVSAMDTAPVAARVDAIVMLDVYEHIPRARASAFHQVLAGMLSPDGVIILTTPSPLHQEHLRATNPGALQIVDEIIGAEQIAELARAVGGVVTSFQYQDIWHSNDYVYSVIERQPRYEKRPSARTWRQKLLQKLPHAWDSTRSARARRRRSDFVDARLGVRVS
jgi:cyclopropane fatty-acyl-phospholipid synthase-like methyltransferase